MELKRKIYGTLLQWKEQSRGRMALMVDVARRVGKSHIVELFVESSTWATRDCWSRTPLGTMVSRRIPSTDKLSVNEGMLMENVVARTFCVMGRKLFFFDIDGVICVW